MFCSVIVATQAIVCKPGICDAITCDNLEDCERRNGIVREKGGFCGCCDLCVVQLREGEGCPPPFMGVPPRRECAEGLYCHHETLTCVRLWINKRKFSTVNINKN